LVQWVDGRVAAAVTVRAFDKDLRSEQLLGEVLTDESGNYDIGYSGSQFNRAEKTSADLIVRVFGPKGELLASSAVVFNAAPEEVVNVLLGGDVLLGPSEYTRITADVEPLLDGVAVADLTEADIVFLAGETDWNAETLGLYAAAAGLSRQTKIPAEVFYGFAREKLSATLNLLLAQSADTQRRALEAAVRENIVPAGVGKTIDSVLGSLKSLVVQQAFAKPSEPGKTSLGALIATSIAKPAQQTDILTRYVDHTGTIEEFWSGLRADPVYAASVDDLQFTLQLGALTANHLPLVNALRQMRAKKSIQDLRDLVALDVDDWKKILIGQAGAPGTGVPPEVPGIDDAEKATNYASILTRMMRDAFPTAAVAHGVLRDDITGKADLTTFFSNNASFDLGTTHIDTYLADNTTTAMTRVSDPAALTQQLKSLQRVYRLTPDYAQMSELLKDNLHSAQAISRISESAFVNRYGPGWGANQAKLVFANAVQTSTTALMLYAEHGAAFNALDLAVLAHRKPPTDGVPNLENLFGSLDLCDCEQCRTVLSPAAYLVDILAFLKHRASTIPSTSAKDILFRRRPDLGQIELTCENTNTPLPYVDLVNELLEDCVSPPPIPFARQTTGTMAELLANPQYLDAAAYAKLQTAVYPWSLPFHLASEEVHVYLEHLGVPRHELMRAFQKPGVASNDPTDVAIAADYLGLNPVESQIITRTLPAPPNPWAFWGYAAAGAWLTQLRTVRSFLDKSGLLYADLVELLDTTFVNPKLANPNLAIVILSTDPLDPGTCDTTKLVITNAAGNLSAADFQSFLDRTHRFVRLWRRLGWTARELDKTISALQGNIADVNQRLNESFLLRLWDMQRLRGELNLSAEQLLALWAPIDTVVDADGDDSAYRTLFQNRAVLNPVDPAFALNSNRTELAIAPTGTISDHSAAILAALGISAGDLTALTASEITGGSLNLANLSKLYRVSLLAKGLRLSIQDTLTLKALSGIDPFDTVNAVNTGNTIRFVEIADKVQDSGFSLAELDYLLRHNASSFSTIPPAEERIAATLDEIRQGLQKISDDTAPVPDPTGDITRKKLALLQWDDALSDQLIATLSDSVSYSAPLTNAPIGVTFPSDLQGRISYDATAQMLQFQGVMSVSDKTTLLSLVDPAVVGSLFAAPRIAVAAQMAALGTDVLTLFDTPASASAADRFQVVLKILLSRLRTPSQDSLVKHKLSDALKIDVNLVDPLLSQRVMSPADPTRTTLSDFLASAFAESVHVPLTAAGFPDQFRAFTLLYKVAMVLAKFAVTVNELPLLFDTSYGHDVGWLDLNALPLDSNALPPSSVAALFNGWTRLADLFALRDQLPLGESVLSDVFTAARAAAPDRVALLNGLSLGTLWDRDSLGVLDGAQGFNFALPGAYKDERDVARLRACIVLMNTLGASAAQCFAWAKAELTLDDAANARQIVRAKYDDAQWLDIARPLRDVVREKQRASLVAWLVANPTPAMGQTVKDANELFAYLLIDVEMSPCQLTSRIKQAISSVQLFTQRCLLNLEPSVVANAQSDMQWREWKWMKSYRVWEANRKIFLYPENWIEPDLRDGKSPFFQDLENDLMQNEVTLETAESALLTYVEKLDGVARLEIVGMYDQQEQDGAGNRVVDILHVFGRTRNSPHLYHYRQRVDSSWWTPWEKIDLDIEGDHLIPMVWNRRLCLFWSIFTDKTRPDTSDGAASDAVIKFWEIQIAWSEFKNKKWAAKRISKAVLEAPNPSFTVDFTSWDPHTFPPHVRSEDARRRPREDFAFKGLLTSGDLAIRIYGRFDTAETVRQSSVLTLKDVLQIVKEQVEDFFDQLPSHPQWPFAEFSFTGCNSEPQVVLKDDLANVTPLVVPLGSLPSYMQFVDQGGAIQEVKLNLVHGNFPISVTRDAASTFESSRLNIVTLDQTPGTFGLLTAHQDRQFTAQRSFFYQDDRRVFFVSPEVESLRPLWSQPGEVGFESVDANPSYYRQPVPIRNPVIVPSLGDLAVGEPSQEVELVDSADVQQVSVLPHYGSRRLYRFETFYHPYICPLLRELNRNGIDGLLQRPAQITPEEFLVPPQTFNFNATYQPEPVVAQPFPVEDVDFSYGGSYSSYNWELFFHVPLLIADRLSKNQRFEDAQQWFHYIFDPTDASGYSSPQKFWRTRRFFETTTPEYRNQQIEQIMQHLAAGTADPEVDDQIKQWRLHPFNPHLIARLRTTAYQKSVVMKYLDNLIAWGDQMFSRDTIETINEATQLYVLASDILGRRPESISGRITPPVRTFNTLEPLLDDFSNALVQVENLVAVVPNSGGGRVIATKPSPLNLPSTLYFCVPKNDKLLGYWDTVADRLFKIRHCMNIEGVVRQLPLFEPPIDPALLVRAAAAGLDINSAINDISAALPHYRFNVMAQKAGEVCAELKGLAGALLAALEKRDAEAIALLRSAEELKVLDAVRQVRQRQVDEAQQSLEATKKSREVVVIRHDYYANIQFLNAGETANLALTVQALLIQAVQNGVDLVAMLSALIPNFKAGFLTTLGVTYGGDNVARSSGHFSQSLGELANILHTGAGLSATLGGYQRRADDWKLQEQLASKELEQFDKQILAAEIRLAIAELELRNHDLQVDNAKEMDSFLHDKFANRELYDWMVSQISGIYFQSYQLTYDLAKRAERAYRYELGLADSNFIQFGYWDSLRKGLLAGDRLSHDLKRMEAAYLDQNKREYELTKHVSLGQLDPIALLQLKNTGRCFVQMPEAIFDLDHPGDYMRRHKSVSVSIPCVAGPYTSVGCKLSLVNSRIRTSTQVSPQYQEAPGGNDTTRFAYSVGTIQSIETSTGQSDSGMFELNFRDERYLPFEGAGVIGTWQIELPSGFRQFDYNTISDVILHLRYTARDGGSSLKNAVELGLKELLNEMVLPASRKGLYQAYDLRHQFPTEWARLKQSSSVAPSPLYRTQLTLGPQHLPFFVQGHGPAIDSVTFLARVSGTHSTYSLSLITPADPNADPNAGWFLLNTDASLAGLWVGSPLTPPPGPPVPVVPELGVPFTLGAADASVLEELTMLVHYKVVSPP
jgi:hypothetical protein